MSVVSKRDVCNVSQVMPPLTTGNIICCSVLFEIVVVGLVHLYQLLTLNIPLDVEKFLAEEWRESQTLTLSVDFEQFYMIKERLISNVAMHVCGELGRGHSRWRDCNNSEVW